MSKGSLHRKRTAVGDGLRIAVLYSYNGASFQGLERHATATTVEGTLLTAIATVIGQRHPDDRVSLVNISRAISTDVGVHASRQVLSLEIGNIRSSNTDEIPDLEELRKHLPPEIMVYEIVPLDVAFSARRMCDSKTYEMLIPTYVFTPPPPATGYCFPAAHDENAGSLYQYDPEDNPIRRQASMKRTKSTKTIAKVHGAQSVMTSNSKKSVATMEEKLPVPKPGVWKRFVSIFKKKKAPVSSEFVDDAATAVNTVDNSPAHSPSVSRKPSTKVVSADLGFTDAPSPMTTIAPTEPIALPELGDDDKQALRTFRISDEQLNLLKHILAIFNGTHNWHNYNNSGSYDDQKSYMRILGLEMSVPEIHADGMEWIRIKIRSSSSFGKQQVQKMIGMAIMVVRTNTPRSVVANSFGFSTIDIPAAPAGFLVLDYVQYDNYNSDASRRGSNLMIDFRKHSDEVTAFRHKMIHDKIYETECQKYAFASWLHDIDSHSYLYTHFLNARGVIVNRPEMPTETKADMARKEVVTSAPIAA